MFRSLFATALLLVGCTPAPLVDPNFPVATLTPDQPCVSQPYKLHGSKVPPNTAVEVWSSIQPPGFKAPAAYHPSGYEGVKLGTVTSNYAGEFDLEGTMEAKSANFILWFVYNQGGAQQAKIVSYITYCN